MVDDLAWLISEPQIIRAKSGTTADDDEIRAGDASGVTEIIILSFLAALGRRSPRDEQHRNANEEQTKPLSWELSKNVTKEIARSIYS